MIFDRVQQTSTTSGTGPIVLDGGAVEGFRAFASVLEDGAKVYYAVIDGNAWEVLEGTFALEEPPELSRDRTLASSNGGSPVNFTGGVKQVFCGIPAELMGAVLGRLQAADTSNTGNAYEVELPVPVPTTLIDGMTFTVRVNAANTGAVTLEVVPAPPLAVVRGNGIPLAAGDWYPDLIARLHYDADADHLLWVDAPAQAGAKVVSTNTYAILASDSGRLLIFTHVAGCAVAIAEGVGAFAAPFLVDLQNESGGNVVVTPTTSTVDGVATLTIEQKRGGQLRSTGGHYRSRRDHPDIDQDKAPVRQTVQSGAVDSNGLPTFITAGAGLSVNIDAAPVPLVVTAANGFDANGAVDRIGIQETDTTISSLANNTTNYLYAEVAADGTLTFGSTTVAPVYQFGGAYSTTSGVFTFNIAEMVGKVGTGAAANQAYRVYLGEAVTSGGSVTSVVNYALQGRYRSAWTATLPGTSVPVSFEHKIGTTEILDDPILEIDCTTTDNGFAVGDRVRRPWTNPGGVYAPHTITITSRNAGQFATGNTGAFFTSPKGGGVGTALTAGSWRYRIIMRRGW